MKERQRPLIKLPDILIILLAGGLTFFSVFDAYLMPRGQVQVLIRGQGGEWAFPVNAEETVTVAGPLGDTVVRIHKGRAWVEASPCENQTCVASGSLVRHGQWAACLPNNVLLMIRGTGDDDVDAVVW